MTDKAKIINKNSNMDDFIKDKTPANKKWMMRFDMKTIQHLGLSMYSTLPPVIGEMVANSYDADATKVIIKLFDEDAENKSIIIEDNGMGMSSDDIGIKFLVIGRNRRIGEVDETPRGRKVIGRKGIGKLAVFGIANELLISSVHENLKNQFRMNMEKIMKCTTGVYYPEPIIVDNKTDQPNRTILELRDLKRKSSFEPNKIAEDLAKRFLIFDKNFQVEIYYNNDPDPIHVNSELRFVDIEREFSWEFPNENIEDEYEHKEEIVGEIFTATKPVPAKLKGVYLVSRGKLVHENSFYDTRADDHAHSYISGYLKVDFIDDDKEEDYISTNRESLKWEDEETSKLKNHLQEVIKFVANERRSLRREKQERIIKEKTGIAIPGWVKSLPVQERSLAKKVTDLILNDQSLDLDKSADLVSFVKDHYDFASFKEFAAQLDEMEDITATSMIEFFKDWEVIEAKEMYKLAIIRLETIRNFEKNIKENVKEKPVMHDFLKTFPWLLDPRIMKLEDEVTYSKILRERFQEPDTVPEIDRRIDFLCQNFADTLYIIELKRPNVKANSTNLDQALDYASFLKGKMGNDKEFSKLSLKTYIICEGIAKSDKAEMKAESYENSRLVYVRTYTELLSQAERYHRDFIAKYEELMKLRGETST